jgi:hypothetical protein
MNINLNDFTKLILEFKLSIASEKMIATNPDEKPCLDAHRLK